VVIQKFLFLFRIQNKPTNSPQKAARSKQLAAGSQSKIKPNRKVLRPDAIWMFASRSGAVAHPGPSLDTNKSRLAQNDNA
jgi:hypothetical protein